MSSAAQWQVIFLCSLSLSPSLFLPLWLWVRLRTSAGGPPFYLDNGHNLGVKDFLCGANCQVYTMKRRFCSSLGTNHILPTIQNSAAVQYRHLVENMGKKTPAAGERNRKGKNRLLQISEWAASTFDCVIFETDEIEQGYVEWSLPSWAGYFPPSSSLSLTLRATISLISPSRCH